MSFEWIRKPWKYANSQESSKTRQGGTGSIPTDPPLPLFIDDGERFKLTKKFVLMLLYQRFSQVFSKVLDQNKSAIKDSDISDADLGLLIGHVIGETAHGMFGRDGEVLEGKALQNYVEFLKAIVTGYSDANLTRNEKLLGKD